MRKRTVVSCENRGILCWFLEHTDLSIVYAGGNHSSERFPEELQKLAMAEKSVFIDLATTSPGVLAELTNRDIPPGSTAVFAETELVEVLPSLLGSPEVQLVDLVASGSPEYKQAKREVRLVLVKPVIQKAIASISFGKDKSTAGRHKWSDTEMERTIDLYLSSQKEEIDVDHAIEELARNLNLSVGQVSMAVDAVGTLDQENPRRYPRPSKRLEQLWKKRGL